MGNGVSISTSSASSQANSRVGQRTEIWMLIDSRGFGGIESHIFQLALSLQQYSIPVRVLFWKQYVNHPLATKLVNHSIPVEYLSGSLSQLLAVLKRQPHVLHTHGYKAGIIGRIVGYLTGTPVVSTFHAGEPGKGKVRLYNWIDRQTSRLSQNIAVSDTISKTLPTSATVIENFVELPNQEGDVEKGNTEKGDVTATRTITAKTPCVAFVGRLSYEKGPDTFCELAHSLRFSRSSQSNQYVLFGDGPMYSDLQKNISRLSTVSWNGR